jgi:ABC-type multidrug transport system ATPase subunit
VERERRPMQTRRGRFGRPGRLTKLSAGIEALWPRGKVLRLEGVRVVRGPVEILRGVDLTFEPERQYVLIGASGSGKSTLLRLLNRLEDPSAGAITVGTTALTTLPIRAVRQAVGLVLQNARPLPGTVAENLAYPFQVRGLLPPDPRQMAEALVEVGLDPGLLDRDSEGLSGGERQRLAIAVALGVGPEILALDEPTAGLDPSSARQIADCLARRSRSTRLRTIVVTHHREHAAWMGDRIAVLVSGRIVDEGPTAEVLARTDATAWAEEGFPREPPE